jgi:hypothetical protein
MLFDLLIRFEKYLKNGYGLDITIKDESILTFLSIGDEWCDARKEIEINKAIRIIDILNEED